MQTRHRTGKTLVLGIGNPLLGDDAFGPSVIERLRLEPAGMLPQVDLVDAHADLLGQIDRFAAFEHVVLVDAILVGEGGIASTDLVVTLEEEHMEAWPEASPGVHQLSPLLAVRLFRRLYPDAATRIHLVGLQTSSVSSRSGLAAEAVAAGVTKVRELLRAFRPFQPKDG